eukprot:TRINITY_DN157_c0_g1_i13.p1 TRINITY_DN157_c0_g1~~TRINITY_DN157_c0_g1_i13.p1  ORF type:complete len:167 (-),score=59.77 TRINITY_DN157_c0_g1_i13:164-640(-)
MGSLLEHLRSYQTLKIMSAMSSLSVCVLFVCVQLALSQVSRGPPRAGGSGADDDGFPTPSGCCDWPSCFDERTQLCLDTCLMAWSQCPKKLFLMTCYSEYMSPFGALPLQCFPDAAPHMEEAEELGITGTAKEVRLAVHKLNGKHCHPKTGICRPDED